MSPTSGTPESMLMAFNPASTTARFPSCNNGTFYINYQIADNIRNNKDGLEMNCTDRNTLYSSQDKQALVELVYWSAILTKVSSIVCIHEHIGPWLDFSEH